MPDSPLPEQQRARLRMKFIVAADSSLAAEQAQHGDLMSVDAPEGYENLWRKVLVALQDLEASGAHYSYWVHADDDSFVRLDLLAELLESSPRERFYWGYIWDGTGSRVTAPIRNTRNKSHMPEQQYPFDFYPPFASGCGFVLSRDLVRQLLKQKLPDYRLLDPPFGIHLCGAERCLLDEPVAPIHDDRVRPYRAIPVFDPRTIVQHYLRPEEMKPYYLQALQHARGHRQEHAGSQGGAGTADAARAASAGDAGVCSSSGGGKGSGGGGGQRGESAAAELYSQLVSMGLLRR